MSQMEHGFNTTGASDNRIARQSSDSHMPLITFITPCERNHQGGDITLRGSYESQKQQENVKEAGVAKGDTRSQTSGDQTLLIEEGENKTKTIIAQGRQSRKTILPPVRATPEVQLPLTVPLSVTTSILTTQQNRKREQCSANRRTTGQSDKIKARPLQDLRRQLLGHPCQTGQCHHLQQLQSHLLLALKSSKRGHLHLSTGYPTLLEHRHKRHPAGQIGPRPHTISRRTGPNGLALPFTTGAPELLTSMRNLMRHNSKNQQTTKQLQ